jgi:asparagine synthase (glutamine-hydrolysing)
MCGIAGSINVSFSIENLKVISHRGPDSIGYFDIECNVNKLHLGQTRLAIVDLTDAGFQPMTDFSGNYTILMNGEIYNHEELRKGIHDVEFKGHSDTETVLYYLINKGINGLKDLNGIFSIVFFDHKSSELFLCRDPFGIKPLYYYFENNKLIFSSEIKFIKNLIKNTEINLDCLYNYLRIRFCPSPQTLFKEIKKIEPGHYLQLNLKEEVQINSNTFYSYLPKKNNKITFDEALGEYDFLVRAAVKRQLMSDVPISIMLSGGVDSALLAHLAQEISGKKLDTFSVGFDLESSSNELINAAETAKWLGSNHHQIIISEEMFKNSSSDLIKIIEEPVGSQSLLPFYFLTKEIQKKGFKVALSGQGVDEAMAGYKRYNLQNTFDNYSHPFWNVLKVCLPFIKNDKIRRGINAIKEKNITKRFIESYSYFDKVNLNNLLIDKNISINDVETLLLNLLNSKANLYELKNHNALDFMMILDSRLALSEDLLLYTDKLAMHNSIEVRVPFLDIELMRFAESLPSKYKISLTKNKILHKKLAEKYLPHDIIYRKKKGFYIPRKEWFKSEAGIEFKNQIASDNSIFNEIFNKFMICKMFDDHRVGKYNYEDQLFSIMNIFFWFKTI